MRPATYRKNSELICERINGRDEGIVKIQATLFDEMQFALMRSRERTCKKLKTEDDDFDRRHAYPICDE